MRIKSGFVVEKVGGSYLAVAVGDRAEEVNALIRMNGTGAFLWRALERADMTSEELLAAMLDEYDVTQEQAQGDISAFICKLREGGLLDE